GNAVGIKLEGSMPQAATIQRNSMQMDGGPGLIIATMQKDQSSFVSNTINGNGGPGIFVATPSTPNTGGHVSAGHTLTGFQQPIVIDMNAHPGTIVSSTAGGICK